MVGASVATLLASGAVPNKTYQEGDVQGQATDGDDNLVIGANGGAGVVAAGAGNDSVIGGGQVDLIAGGEGVDDIDGGAGVDVFLVLGVIENGNYSLPSFASVGVNEHDLRDLIDIDNMNNHPVSDLEPGDSLDGGADGADLYIFGDQH